MEIIVIAQLRDEDNIYEIGDRVRVKLKPNNPDRPELASEHIGDIDNITKDYITIATCVGMRNIYIEHIDKIRFAAAGEDFDNTWEFEEAYNENI